MKSIKNETPVRKLPVDGATLPEIFLKQVENYGSKRIALRQKTGNMWREFTWQDYLNYVEKVAGGLLQAGVTTSDKICIVSNNCPEWLFIGVATQSLGAWLVPIYPNSTPDQLQYIVEHSGAKVLFVEDDEQMTKAAKLQLESTQLELIVRIFPDKNSLPANKLFKHFLQQGEHYGHANPGFLQKNIAALSPESPAGIIYTSGTTGHPKGVLLSQRNILFETASLLTMHDYIWEEDTISFLPLSHIAEQLQNFCIGISAGFRTSFVQNMQTVKDDLLEVRPTVFFSVPRLYEKVRAGILETVAVSSPIKKFLFNWAIQGGEKMRVYRNSTKDTPFTVKLIWRLVDKIVLGKIRVKLGLNRVKLFISGAAPLPIEVSRFFGALGIDIYEAFGQTECTGVCSATMQHKTVPGAVGAVLPGCEVRIAEDGEILVKGDNLFAGYLNNEAATQEVLRDGWLHTGDIGFFDDNNYLHITDRKKDILVTAGGKNIAPQNIESLLKCYPGIGHVAVIGDRKKYLTCLVTLDKEG
ncbi:MAG: long-chain fatty acid--CoA ligase, partial [Deferribacteres bacterium]|nr:long-chain fatty acid--CoA ligase [Deferribacteres bacterium]